MLLLFERVIEYLCCLRLFYVVYGGEWNLSGLAGDLLCHQDHYQDTFHMIQLYCSIFCTELMSDSYPAKSITTAGRRLGCIVDERPISSFLLQFGCFL